MKSSFFLTIALLGLSLTLFTGCDRLKKPAVNEAEVNWLVGTWVVDRDETMQHFVDGAVARLGIDASGAKALITKKVASATVAKTIKPLDNLEFKFTEDLQYSKEAAGFGGDFVPYKITGRPASNQITISEGGETRTYIKEGKNIWYEEDILVGKIKIYLIKK